MPNNNNIPVCGECLFFESDMCFAEPPTLTYTSVPVSGMRPMCREFVDRIAFIEDEGLLADEDKSEEEEPANA
jgi:hypothetical protein